MMNEKRGQITIFVIIGIIIVVGVVLFFLVRSEIITLPTPTDSEDIDYRTELRNCFETNEGILEDIDLVTKQGGSFEPEIYYEYRTNKYEYLCYTGNYYENCVMQQPLILQHTESEIENRIGDYVRECVAQTNEKFRKKGYQVVEGRVEFSFELVPKNKLIKINPQTTISKDEQRLNYNQEVEIKSSSGLYELIMLSTSILNYEARYGDSEIDPYMVVYPEIRIEKNKQSDGTTLYFLRNRITEEEFNFAVRSIAWPAGYGF
jgi:hypothetical protein